MANLLCFPHYTCGGLLCDILNNKISPMGPNGTIFSIEHSLGKIGDTDTVQQTVDVEKFVKTVEPFLQSDTWIGTHAWPQTLPIEKFQKTIVITTATYRSKIYRWARSYHCYFKHQWTNLQDMQYIDKARETAKNYLVAFEPCVGSGFVNLEFADVVDQTPEFLSLVSNHNSKASLLRWQKANAFLFDGDFWNSFAAKTFFQAEYESSLNRYYRYS